MRLWPFGKRRTDTGAARAESDKGAAGIASIDIPSAIARKVSDVEEQKRSWERGVGECRPTLRAFAGRLAADLVAEGLDAFEITESLSCWLGGPYKNSGEFLTGIVIAGPEGLAKGYGGAVYVPPFAPGRDPVFMPFVFEVFSVSKGENGEVKNLEAGYMSPVFRGCLSTEGVAEWMIEVAAGAKTGSIWS